MWIFYNKHLTYNRVDPKELKGAIDGAYRTGNSGTEKIESVDAQRAKTVANISALNKTLEMFPDLNPGRSLVRLCRERLDQEQKWLIHYDKCVDAAKRGYAKLLADSKELRAEAYQSGKIEAEKAIKAKLDAERVAKAKADAEAAEKARVEREKQQQNNNNQNNDKNKQNNNNQNNDKNKQQNHQRGVTLVVENMIVKGEKKDKKGDKKLKGLFKQTVN